jgi:KamA family protein
MFGQQFHMKSNGFMAERYKAYTLRNYRTIPQVRKLDDEIVEAIEVVGRVLPFKVNNYVIDKLIDWQNIPADPLFTLTFPRREMLLSDDYETMRSLLEQNASEEELETAANDIRLRLNPHPAGQEKNLPVFEGEAMSGIQHKYEPTVLFFPTQGQTCHAYCTFCFRWPQFVGMDDMKFAMRDAAKLVRYVQSHKQVTNVLFTGGDPMVMNSRLLGVYIDALLEARIEHLRSIRIGTKSLSYWPMKYINEEDSENVLKLFQRIVAAGKHLAFMAHFNHPRELETAEVAAASANIRATGAEIRTQAPLLAHVNDRPDIWQRMWSKQVQLGMIPYYMFAVRDTGAADFFSVPLVEAYYIYKHAFENISGLAKTVRGPSMSADPGKINVLGVSEINGEQVIALTMLQGRRKEWVNRPFFAAYDEQATWIDELKPAFGEREFFFARKTEDQPHSN